jgi:hypothetical protein
VAKGHNPYNSGYRVAVPIRHDEEAGLIDGVVALHGKDVHGKKAMAEELAKLVFGSYTKFALLNAGNTGKLALKRRRWPNVDHGYVGVRLFEAIIEDPHRVLFINDIDQLDHESEIAIKNVIVTGRIMGCNGGGVASLEDAIIVLSSKASELGLLASSSPPTKRRRIGEGGAEQQVESRCVVFDLNDRMEEVEEEEEENLVDTAGIMGVVDGVFHFD